MQPFGTTTTSKPKFYYVVYDMCRDKGPKSIYRAVGLVRGRLVLRGQINDNEDVRIRTPRASYD